MPAMTTSASAWRPVSGDPQAASEVQLGIHARCPTKQHLQDIKAYDPEGALL